MDNLEELKQKVRALEIKLIKKEKIQKVLMDRVEKSINSSGNAYTLFKNNIILEETVKKRTAERQKALAEVKVLRGLLPICSYCKNIRNSEGYWQAIEMYIGEHSAAEFTHGICEECMKNHFSEI